MSVSEQVAEYRERLREYASRRPRYYERKFNYINEVAHTDFTLFSAAKRARRIAKRELRKISQPDDPDTYDKLRLAVFGLILGRFNDDRLLPMVSLDVKIDRRSDGPFTVNVRPFRPGWATDRGWERILMAYRAAFFDIRLLPPR